MKHSFTGCVAVICCALSLNTHAQFSTLEKVTSLTSLEWHENSPVSVNDGKFRYGIPDGEWRGYYPNGQTKFIRSYSADKYQRIKQEMRKDSRQIFTPLAQAAKEDQRVFYTVTSGNNRLLNHGLYMNFYPSGLVKDSGYYVNGLREDYWIEFTDNGSFRTAGRYLHGRKAGVWTLHAADGKLLVLTRYSRKGKVLSQKKYS
ncbi:toxin-antitoxin system YwqK family antitoxin [Flavihumibacter petaseus]|nr:hypothetical protein [Flavihumibacter petaseus]